MHCADPVPLPLYSLVSPSIFCPPVTHMGHMAHQCPFIPSTTPEAPLSPLTLEDHPSPILAHPVIYSHHHTCLWTIPASQREVNLKSTQSTALFRPRPIDTGNTRLSPVVLTLAPYIPGVRRTDVPSFSKTDSQGTPGACRLQLPVPADAVTPRYSADAPYPAGS